MTTLLALALLARWEAGGAAQGLSLVRGRDADWRIEKTAQGVLAAVAPVNDYFRRAAFLVRSEKAARAPAWLTVEFLDRGYGLISVASRGAARLKQR